MKRLYILSALLLIFGVVACEKKADLSKDKAKYSYALGYKIAENIKAQNIDLDAVAFAQAIKDVKKGKEALKEEQRREAMKKMSEMAREKDRKAAEGNKKKGDEFLAANKTKEGVKTTESGLQYKVLTEGKGKKPTPDSVVKVHYRGSLIDGKEFDSSYKRKTPAEFPVKAVIKGWTEALQLMKVGSKYKLFIPPDLAYGPRGNPTIPGNSVLIFEVELLDIVKK